MKWAWSYWEQDLIKGKYDLIIIGAGFSGLASAYFIQKKNPSWKILLVDKAQFQRAASTRNAGLACISSLSELLEDVRHNGWDQTLELIEWRWKGLGYLKNSFSQKDIGFSKVDAGELFIEGQEYAAEKYLHELDEANRQLEQITGGNYYKLEETFPAAVRAGQHYISHLEEGQLHPARLMKAWMKKCRETGIELLENCEVSSFEESNGEIRINSSWGKFKADRLLQCTNADQFGTGVREDMEMVPNVVFVSSPLAELQWHGNIHAEAGFIYARNIHNRLLIGGGRHILSEADQRNLTEESRNRIWNYLQKFAARHIESVPEKWQAEFQWTGFLGMGKEKRPIIEAKSNNVFLLGRLSGMGVALSSYLGEKMATLIDKY